eukprot:840539-Pyramimonas_sp.AAC.1
MSLFVRPLFGGKYTANAVTSYALVLNMIPAVIPCMLAGGEYCVWKALSVIISLESGTPHHMTC